MFKLYSKGCEYAIRALVYVTGEERDQEVRFQAAEICKRADIPEAYTRKVFQSLVQGGFLEAHRGPGGGYSLTRPSDEITILDVILAVDGEETFDQCVMGLPGCGGDMPCPLHFIWEDAKGRMLSQLRNCSLQEIRETVETRWTAKRRGKSK
jgi:Rrf2 family transcriptional regulator, iron-sulfur cluster assembly transcription factor